MIKIDGINVQSLKFMDAVSELEAALKVLCDEEAV